MVTVTKTLPIAENPNLAIYSPEGDYADTDLILCEEKNGPGIATAQLQAQYLKYGPVVYQFNTPEELGAALFLIDPESTHDAVLLYKEEEARKAAREQGTLTPSDPVAAPDSNAADVPADVPNDQEPDTQFFNEQAAQEEASSTATTTSQTGDAPVPDTSGEVLGEATSSPDGTLPEATSTPPIDTPVEVPIDTGNTSTTTPSLPPEEVLPAVDLSTTTPE